MTRDFLPDGAPDTADSPLTAPIRIGYAAVDGFFVLTGVLTAFPVLARSADADAAPTAAVPYTLAPRSLWAVWKRRFSRVWPPYVFTIAMYCLVIFRDGLYPLEQVQLQGTRDAMAEHFPDATHHVNMCFLAPANLLMSNNWMPLAGCMGWTWSLAVQAHFWVAFPLALRFIGKRVRAGRALAIAAAAQVLCGFALRWFALYTLIMGWPRSPDRDFWMFFVYSNTLTRMGTISAGVVVAYASVSGHAQRWLARGSFRAAGWLVTAATFAVNLWWIGFPDSGFGQPPSWLMAYNYPFGAGGPGFTMSFAFVLLVLLNPPAGAGAAGGAPPGGGRGHGRGDARASGSSVPATAGNTHVRAPSAAFDVAAVSAVRRCLSLAAWRPIAAVSFMGYLWHPIVMFWTYSNVLYPLHASTPMFLWYAGFHVVFVLVVAAAVHVVVERPLDVLLR